MRRLGKCSLMLIGCFCIAFWMRNEILAATTLLLNLSHQQFELYLSLTSQKSEPRRELLLLQMLFRHGHRSPFMLYPTDPNNESFWKEGLGCLTKIGRLQHYRLGAHLQERYKDFITTNPKEVEVLSGVSSRTQHGGYSFLAGLYAPKDEFRFTNDIRWQPIVTKTASNNKNILLLSNCSLAYTEFLALQSSKLFQDNAARFKDLYRFWSINSGRLIENWHLANDLGKTLSSEEKYNLTIPEWANLYRQEFQTQTALNYYFHYGTKILMRYSVGPLLEHFIEKMNDKIAGKDSQKRVFVYSGHGSNIVRLLMAMNRYNWLEPPPASVLVLELWKEEDKDLVVRWLFFNSTSPETQIDPPYALSFEECGGEFCPLKMFIEKTKQFIPEDFERECDASTSTIMKSLDMIKNPLLVNA